VEVIVAVNIYSMIVFCEGTSDAPHPRREVAKYYWEGGGYYHPDRDGRWLKQPTTTAVWVDGSWEENENAVHGSAIRLRCKDCGDNEKRRLDRSYGPEFPPFSAVFDVLGEHGINEISVRALVDRVQWDAPSSA
jgi:hypothetical protein